MFSASDLLMAIMLMYLFSGYYYVFSDGAPRFSLNLFVLHLAQFKVGKSGRPLLEPVLFNLKQQ